MHLLLVYSSRIWLILWKEDQIRYIKHNEIDWDCCFAIARCLWKQFWCEGNMIHSMTAIERPSGRYRLDTGPTLPTVFDVWWDEKSRHVIYVYIFTYCISKRYMNALIIYGMTWVMSTFTPWVLTSFSFAVIFLRCIRCGLGKISNFIPHITLHVSPCWSMLVKGVPVYFTQVIYGYFFCTGAMLRILYKLVSEIRAHYGGPSRTSAGCRTGQQVLYVFEHKT